MRTERGHYAELWQRGDNAAAEAHLRECEDCRLCFGRMEAPAAPLSKFPSLPPQVEPVRPVLSSRASSITLLLYAAFALGAAGWTAGVAGISVAGPPSLLIAALTLAGMIAAAGLLSRVTIPGESLPGWARYVVLSALVLFPAAAWTLLPLEPSRGLGGHGGCLLFGLGFAAGFAPPIVFAARRRRVREWGLTAPVLGAFAGLTGLLALVQHCPILEASHVTLLHWPSAVAAVGFGLVAGRIVDLDRQWKA